MDASFTFTLSHVSSKGCLAHVLALNLVILQETDVGSTQFEEPLSMLSSTESCSHVCLFLGYRLFSLC